MAKEIKSKLNVVIIFVANFLLVIVVVLVLKSYQDDNFKIEEENTTKIVPIDLDVLELQNQISTSRENKLRDLNSSPKELKQEDVTTTVTEIEPDRETKTS